MTTLSVIPTWTFSQLAKHSNVTTNMTSSDHDVTHAGELASGCLVLQETFDAQDDPDTIVSKQTEYWVTVISSAGVIPVLFLIGCPSNVLSAAVFYAQGLRERINLCVFSLALIDAVVLFVTLCLSVEQAYRTLVGPSSFFITYFVGLTGFTWVSMFLSAVISSERCFCVVSPLRAQRHLTTRTTTVFLAAASLLLLAGMLVIAGPKHTVVCLYDPHTNMTSQIVYVTKYAGAFGQYYQRHKKVLDIFDVFVYATALPFVFLLVIVVTTSITALKLRSAARWRIETSSSAPASASERGAAPSSSVKYHKDPRDVALTKMLIATSVLFVVCLCPMLLVQVAMFLEPELKFGGRYHNLTSVLWSVISACRCVNSSFNFFVYHRLGSRFRHTFRQLVLCSPQRRRNVVRDTGTHRGRAGLAELHQSAYSSGPADVSAGRTRHGLYVVPRCDVS